MRCSMKNIVLIALIFLCCGAAAQTVTLGLDDISFHSTQNVDNGTTYSSVSNFVFRGSSEVEWTYNSGQDKSTYTVTSISGSWPDLNTEGQMEFNVTLGPRSGKIIVRRTGSSSIKIRIEMYRGTVDLVPVEFIISSFQELN
jgi:hypothetical protein